MVVDYLTTLLAWANILGYKCCGTWTKSFTARAASKAVQPTAHATAIGHDRNKSYKFISGVHFALFFVAVDVTLLRRNPKSHHDACVRFIWFAYAINKFWCFFFFLIFLIFLLCTGVEIIKYLNAVVAHGLYLFPPKNNDFHCSIWFNV